jgi:hypothetical protein
MTELGQTPSRTCKDDLAIITTVARPEVSRDSTVGIATGYGLDD